MSVKVSWVRWKAQQCKNNYNSQQNNTRILNKNTSDTNLERVEYRNVMGIWKSRL